MTIEEYRIKLDRLKEQVSIASNYFILSDLVKEYQNLAEQLLESYGNHEFFFRLEKENEGNLRL